MLLALPTYTRKYVHMYATGQPNMCATGLQMMMRRA